MKIKKGELVLLISSAGHRYYETVRDEELHLSDGKLNLKDLVGSKFGKPLKNHLGKEYLVLKPDFIDVHKTLKRGPQVILPKDAATIVAQTGLGPGGKVVDAGTGSGWLSSFLAHIVGPTGKVTTYEKRKDFHLLSKENMKTLGLKNVILKNKDVTKGITERNLDLITLDLLTPAEVPNISQALKLGGFCIAYVPHMKQAEEFATFASKEGLLVEQIIEMRQDNYKFEKSKVKRWKRLPHTGYLVITRKVRE